MRNNLAIRIIMHYLFYQLKIKLICILVRQRAYKYFKIKLQYTKIDR